VAAEVVIVVESKWFTRLDPRKLKILKSSRLRKTLVLLRLQYSAINPKLLM